MIYGRPEDVGRMLTMKRGRSPRAPTITRCLSAPTVTFRLDGAADRVGASASA